MKFALGTAGWRTNYGSFSHEIIQINEAKKLVDTAWELGFEFIDTAPGYGDTEKLLGSIDPKQSIATKVAISLDLKISIENSVEQSLSNLGIKSIPLIFVHNWDKLSESVKKESSQILNDLMIREKIYRWGISTYEISEIYKYKELDLKNTVFQINVNILDQRLDKISNQVRHDLRSRNIEIWARSIFLQGILINHTPENKLLNHPDVIKFYKKSVELELDPIDLCLSYIKQNELIDVAIIGIPSISQLKSISKIMLNQSVIFNFKEFNSSDLDLVDPRRWNLKNE